MPATDRYQPKEGDNITHLLLHQEMMRIALIGCVDILKDFIKNPNNISVETVKKAEDYLKLMGEIE
jgi:hypothetical protein